MKKMSFIKQKHSKDCGVAAIAMLCNATYEDADRVIPWRKHGYLYGTDTKMLRIAAERLGYTGQGTLKQQLKRLPKGAQFTALPDNSLVKVPHPDGRNWHWVAWRKGKVYDPARGVFTAEKCGYIPSSYMEFKKGIG